MVVQSWNQHLKPGDRSHMLHKLQREHHDFEVGHTLFTHASTVSTNYYYYYFVCKMVMKQKLLLYINRSIYNSFVLL